MSEVKLTADSGGGTVAWKAPATTTSNAAVTLTLPQNDGDASQYLQTNGSGVLSWAAAGGGKVVKTDFQTHDTQVVENSGSWTATGLTKSYTPLSGSNDLIIICFQYAYCTLASGTGDVRAQWRLVHDGNTLITSQIDGGSGGAANEHSDHITFVYKVNADDTDARDIKTEFKKVAGSSAYSQLNGRLSTFVVLEVEAN